MWYLFDYDAGINLHLVRCSILVSDRLGFLTFQQTPQRSVDM